MGRKLTELVDPTLDIGFGLISDDPEELESALERH